jgi:DNA primase
VSQCRESRNGAGPRLTIAADGDGPGLAAANDLAARAHGLGWAVSLLPAPEGRDWNDVKAMGGAA